MPPSRATLSAIPEIASSATLSLAPAASSASDAGAEQLLRQKYQEIQGKVLRGRNDEARRDFLKLASDFPGSAIAPEALFAAAQLEKASVKTRLAEFQALTTRFPGTIWATRSLCQIGQTQFLLGNWSESLKAYRAYRDQHGEEAGKPAMRMDMTKCCLQLRQYEEGLAELERLEADYPNLRSTEQVLDLKSECQMALSRYDEAIYSLQTLLRSYPNFELAPKAVLCLGLCYEQIGRPQDAKPLYTQLIQTYPADRADTPAETRMAQERLAQLDKPLLGGK
jgi:TolA-binding protein